MRAFVESHAHVGDIIKLCRTSGENEPVGIEVHLKNECWYQLRGKDSVLQQLVGGSNTHEMVQINFEIVIDSQHLVLSDNQ